MQHIAKRWPQEAPRGLLVEVTPTQVFLVRGRKGDKLGLQGVQQCAFRIYETLIIDFQAISTQKKQVDSFYCARGL